MSIIRICPNSQFFQDDESYHDYPDDFHDDFDDQPTISDRVCDNAQEKAILFDLTGSDTVGVLV